MRTIDRRPGYRSVHDETTKWAKETSEFIDNVSLTAMAGEAMRSEAAGHVHSCCWARSSRPRREWLSIARLQYRQGQSPPSNGTKVENRNTGTRIVCPVRSRARCDGQRWTTPRAELP